MSDHAEAASRDPAGTRGVVPRQARALATRGRDPRRGRGGVRRFVVPRGLAVADPRAQQGHQGRALLPLRLQGEHRARRGRRDGPAVPRARRPQRRHSASTPCGPRPSVDPRGPGRPRRLRAARRAAAVPPRASPGPTGPGGPSGSGRRSSSTSSPAPATRDSCGPSVDPASFARMVVDTAPAPSSSPSASRSSPTSAGGCARTGSCCWAAPPSPSWLEGWRAEGGMAAVLGPHLLETAGRPGTATGTEGGGWRTS